MIQLYHNDMSSCAQKVRIVLAEKGLEWKSHHLSLRDGESRTSEYKKLNPNGVVPTLITDNNETIIESTVIMEYLDEKYPTPPLKSVAPYSRALTRLWMKQLDEGIHLSLASISNALAFRYQHIEGKSEEELQKYFEGIPDPSRRERIWDLTKNGVESKHFLPAIQRFEKLFLEVPGIDGCSCNECPYMRLNTLEKLLNCLQSMSPKITMDEETRLKALKPIQYMLQMSK